TRSEGRQGVHLFEALDAWAWEHDLGRQPEETPLEFTERLCTLVPKLEDEVRGLAGLYVHLAYARTSLPPAGVSVLKRGVCNFLFCDGHAASLTRDAITKTLFYVTTSN